jgi:SAM-dependent methyltransferase
LDKFPKTLLDLGCGTGRHGLELTSRGVTVDGVDLSETMLTMARQAAGNDQLAFHLGDARTVRLGRTFDAVISLFHVMSYQTSEDDALAEMLTAKAHLKSGGVFFFDFWHGPGVVADPPTHRTKLMEDDATKVSRQTVPVHHVENNIVDVNFEVALMDKQTGSQTVLNELHRMRYWFLPELRYLAKQAGLTVAAEGPWMTEGIPGLKDWNAWMALKL